MMISAGGREGGKEGGRRGGGERKGSWDSQDKEAQFTYETCTQDANRRMLARHFRPPFSLSEPPTMDLYSDIRLLFIRLQPVRDEAKGGIKKASATLQR